MRRIRPARRWSGSLRPLDSIRLFMSELAREVYGERADWENSSLTAFCYCYRRFGPPPRGTDDYKQLGGAWILKTRDPEIYLGIDPGGCAIGLYLAQYASEELHAAAERPGWEWRREARRRYLAAHPGASYDDWQLASLEDDQPWLEGMPPYPRCPEEIVQRALAALRHVLLDLLRPVYVRDAPINLFGRIDDDNPSRGRTAEYSHFAGWGVPVRDMEVRIREHEAERRREEEIRIREFREWEAEQEKEASVVERLEASVVERLDDEFTVLVRRPEPEEST